ncbi:carbamoyl phosphate synthase preATP-grasp domain-containing protein, partial [Bacillus velezensis]
GTIMRDEGFGDEIYFEGVRRERMEGIIKKEKGEGVLGNLGGQTGLNLGVKVEEGGVVKKDEVKLLGRWVERIEKGEDREELGGVMKEVDERVGEREIVEKEEDGLGFGECMGFGVIV